MDFLIGILLIIIVMLILYNFSSVSMSNTKSNGTCSNNTVTTQYNIIPSPILSKSPSALNNKVNLNAQAYDYNKYFFI
jgi:hypothetical protein